MTVQGCSPCNYSCKIGYSSACFSQELWNPKCHTRACMHGEVQEGYLAFCHVMGLCCGLQDELQLFLAQEALQAVLGVHLCPTAAVKPQQLPMTCGRFTATKRHCYALLHSAKIEDKGWQGCSTERSALLHCKGTMHSCLHGS